MHEINYQSPTERVQVWIEAAALHIRFNNPARHNALSADMWEAIPPLLAQAEGDERVRLVVFSGAGEKAFVSGADISQFEDMRAAREAVSRYEVMAENALMGIHHFSKPTLACIRGYCIGGGVNVAISCDLRIASSDSVFSIPAARLGLGYRYSAMKNLVDLIGPGAAKDLFFTARKIDAEEARSMGLIARVCAPEALAAVLRRGLPDDLHDRRGNRCRRPRSVEHLRVQHGRQLTCERRLAVQKLVKNHPERVDVGARIDLLALDLLRRHIRRRADHAARGGQPMFVIN